MKKTNKLYNGIGPKQIEVKSTFYSCAECIYYEKKCIWYHCIHPKFNLSQMIDTNYPETPGWCPEK